MKFFHLPDLGEGIPEADIVKWHVAEGAEVKEDQIIVSVETAKSVVEVPSPVTGVIARFCGKPGETILTGEPLVEFVSDHEDSGTVVGKLAQENHTTDSDESFSIGAPPSSEKNSQINTGTASEGLASLAKTYNINVNKANKRTLNPHHYPLKNPEPLKGVRKHMAKLMAESHANVVPVTLFDDVSIQGWKKQEDITVRLIQALISACKVEPSLNAWFDGTTLSREIHSSIDLGLAVDSSDGLFVPIIRSAETLSGQELRMTINTLREGVKDRSLSPAALQGSTIALSNFGVFSGAYGTPIIIPPTVCIVGVGKIYEGVVSINGKPASHNLLPISLSFDHRSVTGGEAARFLKEILDSLRAP